MPKAIGRSIWENFLGEAPDWYKYTLIGFLVLNPVILLVAGPFPTGWVLLAEVIFTLAMALKCYPLPPSGLLAVQSVLLGMTTPQSIYNETAANL
ncbi:MAG TPA: hypothetical protein PKV86_02915, partial [Syntrophobacteraceae bacterium]|nr:hypothetical protein [Syntrophobacteraceae bacterium]